MGFKLIKRGMMGCEPFVTLPVKDSEAITAEEALVLSSGVLTKCGATTKPTHIAVQSVTAGTSKSCVVFRIQPDMEFKTTSTATLAATTIGTAVTLHTDGLTVTDTTTSGVATIVTTDGATTNSNVTVRFI